MPVAVKSFMDNLTVQLDDGRMMQMTAEEGRALAIELNTHFARAAAAKNRVYAPCDVEN